MCIRDSRGLVPVQLLLEDGLPCASQKLRNRKARLLWADIGCHRFKNGRRPGTLARQRMLDAIGKPALLAITTDKANLRHRVPPTRSRRAPEVAGRSRQ